MIYFYSFATFLYFTWCIIFLFADEFMLKNDDFKMCPLSFDTIFYLKNQVGSQNDIINLSHRKMDFCFDPYFNFHDIKEIFMCLKNQKVYIDLDAHVFELFLNSTFIEFIAKCKKFDLMKIINSKVYYFLKKKHGFIKKIFYYMLKKNIHQNDLTIKFFMFVLPKFSTSKYSHKIKEMIIENDEIKLITYIKQIINEISSAQSEIVLNQSTFEFYLLNWNESREFLFDLAKNNVFVSFRDIHNNILLFISENIPHKVINSLFISPKYFPMDNFLKMYEFPIFFHTIHSLNLFEKVFNILKNFDPEYQITLDISKIYFNIINEEHEQANEINQNFIHYFSHISSHFRIFKLQILFLSICYKYSTFEKFISKNNEDTINLINSNLILHASMSIQETLRKENHNFCLTNIANKYIEYFNNQIDGRFVQFYFLYFKSHAQNLHLTKLELKCENRILDIHLNSKCINISQIGSIFANFPLQYSNQKSFMNTESILDEFRIVKFISIVIDNVGSTVVCNSEKISKVSLIEEYKKYISEKMLIQSISIFSKPFYFFISKFDILFKQNLKIISTNLNSEFDLQQCYPKSSILHIKNCKIYIFNFQLQKIDSIKIYNSTVSFEPQLNLFFDEVSNLYIIDFFAYKTIFENNFVLKGTFNKIILSSCSSKLRIEAKFISITLTGPIEEYIIFGKLFFSISSNASCSYFHFDALKMKLEAINICFSFNSFLEKISKKKLINCVIENSHYIQIIDLSNDNS